MLPALKAAGIAVPNEIVNDCDPGDKEYITNTMALQSMFLPGSLEIECEPSLRYQELQRFRRLPELDQEVEFAGFS